MKLNHAAKAELATGQYWSILTHQQSTSSSNERFQLSVKLS
jgi:hypothetical protein